MTKPRAWSASRSARRAGLPVVPVAVVNRHPRRGQPHRVPPVGPRELRPAEPLDEPVHGLGGDARVVPPARRETTQLGLVDQQPGDPALAQPRDPGGRVVRVRPHQLPQRRRVVGRVVDHMRPVVERRAVADQIHPGALARRQVAPAGRGVLRGLALQAREELGEDRQRLAGSTAPLPGVGDEQEPRLHRDNQPSQQRHARPPVGPGVRERSQACEAEPDRHRPHGQQRQQEPRLHVRRAQPAGKLCREDQQQHQPNAPPAARVRDERDERQRDEHRRQPPLRVRQPAEPLHRRRAQGGVGVVPHQQAQHVGPIGRPAVGRARTAGPVRASSGPRPERVGGEGEHRVAAVRPVAHQPGREREQADDRARLPPPRGRPCDPPPPGAPEHHDRPRRDARKEQRGGLEPARHAHEQPDQPAAHAPRRPGWTPTSSAPASIALTPASLYASDPVTTAQGVASATHPAMAPAHRAIRSSAPSFIARRWVARAVSHAAISVSPACSAWQASSRHPSPPSSPRSGASVIQPRCANAASM